MVKLTTSQKIALPTVVLILLLQISLGAVALDHEKNALLNQLDVRATDLAQFSETLSAQSQRSDITQTAQSLGQTLLKQNDVVFCQIEGQDNSRLFRSGTLNDQDVRDYCFPIILTHSSDSETKGSKRTVTLSISLATTDMKRTLAQGRGVVIVAILAGTATSLLLVILIVRHAQGNPQTRLSRKFILTLLNEETSDCWPSRAEVSGIDQMPLAELNDSQAETVTNSFE